MYAQFLPLMAQHGVDHRDFAILAYGGAGPTHAFFLAREVGIRTVIVPPSPGTFCALGCLLADLRADYVRTVYADLVETALPELAAHLERVEEEGIEWLDEEQVPPAERVLLRSADLRYKGQSFEVAVRLNSGGLAGLRELAELFHARHGAVYGFADESAAVEVINLRVQAVGSAPKPSRLAPKSEPEPAIGDRLSAPRRREVMIEGALVEAAVYRRGDLPVGAVVDGPAIVVQYDTTVVVPPSYQLTVDQWLNLVGEHVG